MNLKYGYFPLYLPLGLKNCWKCNLSSENLSVYKATWYDLWLKQNWLSSKPLYHAMSFAPSTILPCNFRLTLLRNTIKSAAKTHFQSYFVFNNSSVQSFSSVRLFATPWITARQASLSITNSQSPPKPMSIESMMPSSHLIFCRPLLLLPPILPSIRVFSNELTLHVRWPKYWSFSFNISPSNEHPGLISFRMDWLHPLQSKGLSRVFSNTTVQKHQFFGS